MALTGWMLLYALEKVVAVPPDEDCPRVCVVVVARRPVVGTLLA
jgi:hypothetical protein